MVLRNVNDNEVLSEENERSLSLFIRGLSTSRHARALKLDLRAARIIFPATFKYILTSSVFYRLKR